MFTPFGMVFHVFWNPMKRRTEFRLDKYGGYEQTVKIPAEIENCPVTQVGPRAFYHYIERIPPLRQSKWWDEFRSSTI